MVICDRDAVIACAGVPRKEYTDKALSEELEKIIEGRSLYVKREDAEPVPVLSDGGNHIVRCAMPIISEGDIIGCVASVFERDAEPPRDAPTGEVEQKLVITAAGFLGRQLEG